MFRVYLPNAGVVKEDAEKRGKPSPWFISLLSVWLRQHGGMMSSAAAGKDIQKLVWDSKTGSSSGSYKAPVNSRLTHPAVLNLGGGEIPERNRAGQKDDVWQGEYKEGQGIEGPAPNRDA